jgi:mitogen-activated protein kinase 7
MQRHTFTALNSTFIVDAEYEFVKELGQGAYGCVVAAKHRRSGEGCAIKKITNINTKRILTKRCLREIKLLHHFRGHKNITCLYDMDLVFKPDGNFDEVYLYEELMEADLHAIIRSQQPLSDAHFQSFIYQTLCGLKYIHSANVIHRDLKPGNLLVNADCELKICDFGLARGYSPGGGASAKAGSNQGFMTEYVATRWYRAPEIMLSFANYSTAIDVWSVGCILRSSFLESQSSRAGITLINSTKSCTTWEPRPRTLFAVSVLPVPRSISALSPSSPAFLSRPLFPMPTLSRLISCPGCSTSILRNESLAKRP